MIDLAKVTFGEYIQNEQGVYILTLSSSADLQVKTRDFPLGFKFRYQIPLS